MTDHYATLGVLPSAEAVVITAAYRALAQRYHPDKWHGDPAVAHDRMSEINEAYRVIGDATLRAEFDASRTSRSHGDFGSADREETNQAFGEALRDVEDRWKIAVGIMPDLVTIRLNLTRISASLAFAYIATVLESKQFNERNHLAAIMERAYLERYFGTDPIVLGFARQLILDGNSAAARTLSNLVDVLGTEVDSALLAKSLKEQHGVDVDHARHSEIAFLAKRLRDLGYASDAINVALLRGWKVDVRNHGFLGFMLEITATRPGCESVTFDEEDAFSSWVLKNLCEGY